MSAAARLYQELLQPIDSLAPGPARERLEAKVHAMLDVVTASVSYRDTVEANRPREEILERRVTWKMAVDRREFAPQPSHAA